MLEPSQMKDVSDDDFDEYGNAAIQRLAEHYNLVQDPPRQARAHGRVGGSRAIRSTVKDQPPGQRRLERPAATRAEATKTRRPVRHQRGPGEKTGALARLRPSLYYADHDHDVRPVVRFGRRSRTSRPGSAARKDQRRPVPGQLKPGDQPAIREDQERRPAPWRACILH